jgi:hypothetical protein
MEANLTDSIEGLRQLISDQESRVKLTEIVAVATLLNDCIIAGNYRISDDWVRALRFTPLGEQTISGCMSTYKRLKPNDAKLAVFLTIGCTEGMLVDISTDLEALRQQVSIEVRQERVRFPYIFGRELHDAAAELFPAQTSLDNSQTIRLLDKLPIGVFQVGRTVVGPYGCTYSDVPRMLEPSSFVPGYSCPEESCTSIHRLSLKTAESSISRAREKVALYIYKNYSKAADPYVPLIRRALMMEELKINSFTTTNLIDLLSDGLDEGELRSVIDHLLRRTFKRAGRKTDMAKRLGALITNPSEFVAALRRPELLQIVLLHSDSDVIAAIDESVLQRQVQLQDSEIRVCKVRRWDKNSIHPLAEIGHLGARFTASPSSRLIAGRMQKLLHTLYYESDFLDAGDLAYAIEAPNDLSPGELLNLALRSYSINDLLKDLVLPNRRAVEVAARELNLFGFENLSREQVLDRLRWKIGDSLNGGLADLDLIDEYLREVRAANEANRPQDIIRASASKLFAAVENALNRALIFSIWTLTTDHYVSQDKFVYDPDGDRSVVEFIEVNAPTSEVELKLKPEKNTLVPLGAGFPRLAKALRRLNEADYVRAEKDVPVACIATSRPFAFSFTCMFFNLTRSAQSDILTHLQAIGRHAQNADVIEVRNWTSHGDHAFPGAQRIANAVENIVSLRQKLHESGLYPRVYKLIDFSRDGVGREELVYASETERLSLFRPMWAIAPRLSTGSSRLIIMPVARTDSSGPLRFALKARPGRDPYWESWPRRWPARAGYSETREIYSE